MNKDHLIYELTEEQQKALMGDGYEGKKIDGKTIETLEQDVARLDGYLKGRADSDAPRIRPNSDLTRRSGDGKP